MATTKQPLPRRRMRHDPFGRMSLAVAKYLESDGWDVVLFGGTRVQRQRGAETSKYEFVLRFTGGPKEKT
jgi:hypothetical protein